MSLKMEFVEKAARPGVRMSVLCREFGISRETGYKWWSAPMLSTTHCVSPADVWTSIEAVRRGSTASGAGGS